MIVRLYNCECKEIIVDSEIFVLEVENPKIFNNILLDLIVQEECAREVAVEINNSLLKPKDIVCVSDFINFDSANKNILSKIYKYLDNDISTQIEKRLKFEGILCDFKQKFMQLLNDINMNFDFAEEVDLKDVFAMLKIKPMIQNEFCILEKLLQYVDICSELKLIKLLVLVNLKSYLSKEELLSFYKHCLYKNINLIILESIHSENILQYEKKVLIDSDYCDIIIHNQ